MIIAAFDLQKVLQVPYGKYSDFFYKQKMSVYNLTVTNLVTCTVTCFLWYQTTAKRGSNEIAICLKYFVKNLSGQIKQVYLFADNCTGQNKNRFITQMLLIAAMERNMTINLIFLEMGHTQNFTDSAHSVIERAKKGVNIHHPSEWVTLTETACSKNPYKVKLMTQNELFNFETDLGGVFDPLIKDKTPGKSSQKNIKVSWLKIKEVRFDSTDDQNIYMNHKYDTESEFEKVTIGELPRKTRLWGIRGIIGETAIMGNLAKGRIL